MEFIPYIDIHTHNIRIDPTVWNIVNVYPDVGCNDNIPTFYSIGIHPWHINPNKIDVHLIQIEQHLLEKQCLCIGEIGLDACIEMDFSIQKSVFYAQLELAQKYNKPVILHCVKYYNEIIAAKKDLHLTIPLILHGFNANTEITEQCIKHGFYFSFGASLLNTKSNSLKTIQRIPYSQLFLETDTSLHDIETIYKKASLLLEMSVQDILFLLFNNFKKFFHYDRI